PDAVLRARAAEGLLMRGSPAVDASGVPPGFLATGRDGQAFPKYEAGASLAALPFVALGGLVERLAPAGSAAIFRGPIFLWYSPEDASTAWRLCVVGLTNAALVALLAWWDWLRFGSVWTSGYGEELTLWITPPLVGLRGLLLSPGRGLLPHFPLAVLALATTPAAWRRSPRTTLFAWGTVATLLAVYCRWHGWDGGWCWG